MGAVIDLPKTCVPFTLEVRSESVYLGDGDATVRSNEGQPLGPSALRVRGRGEVVRGEPIPTIIEWSVGAEHLDALTRTVTKALRHRSTRNAEPSGATATRAADGSLVVSGGQAWSYGIARDGTWEPTTVVEVMHGDLPVFAAALTALTALDAETPPPPSP